MIHFTQAMDINFLKANCKKIHFFGLGFIQIKLSDKQRVHVYTDKLKSTVTEEDVHNHRYDFTSEILKGTFRQEVYKVQENQHGTFLKVQESCNPDNKIQAQPIPVDMGLQESHTFVAGSAYTIKHDVFHRVFSTDAVTFVTRSGYKKDLADVVYHSGQTLVCPFSVKVSEEELWKIVEEALK